MIVAFAVARTLFRADWAPHPTMQRRARIGLNKGESHHAPTNALGIDGNPGRIRQTLI